MMSSAPASYATTWSNTLGNREVSSWSRSLRIAEAISLRESHVMETYEGRPRPRAAPRGDTGAAGLYDQPSAPLANGCRAALYLASTSSIVGLPCSARAIDSLVA